MNNPMRNLVRRAYYALNRPMIGKRRKYRNSMPYVNLEGRHTENSGLLPNRLALLNTLPKSALAAELGVASGSFSEKILDICRPRKLHLVDAWHTDRYRDDRNTVVTRFAKEIQSGLVTIHEGLSMDILKTFGPTSLDWVYIDTNHSYETTAAELLECERIVKPEGRILGHDFCLGNIVKPVVFGVIPAVNEFCVTRDWQFEYVTLESNGFFSFSLRKIMT